MANLINDVQGAKCSDGIYEYHNTVIPNEPTVKNMKS